MATKPSDWDARERFEAQFTPAGEGFLYRRGGYGPGYRVTRCERDAFVAAFDRQRHRLLAALCVAGFVAVMMLLLASRPISAILGDVSYPALWFWTAVLLFILFAAAAYWIDAAPQRALADRHAVAAALSREERRRLKVEQISWWQITSALFVMIVNLVRIVGHWAHDAEDGIYLVIYALIAALLVWQSMQKWRFEHNG